jgi:hypothetical protein
MLQVKTVWNKLFYKENEIFLLYSYKESNLFIINCFYKGKNNVYKRKTVNFIQFLLVTHLNTVITFVINFTGNAS